MRLVLVEPPAVELLTADEAKERLNIGDEVSDDLMDSFILAARQQLDGADGWLGRALITQTWQGTLDAFPCDIIELPLPPLQSVNSISYVDSYGDTIVLDGALYQLVLGARPYLVSAYGETWPSSRLVSDAVTINFTAGYGDEATDVPEPIRAAIALLVGKLRSLYERNLFVSSETAEGIGSKTYVVGGNAGVVIDSAVESLLSGYRVYR